LNLLRPGAVRSDSEGSGSVCVYMTNPGATNEPSVHTAGLFLNGKQFYRAVA